MIEVDPKDEEKQLLGEVDPKDEEKQLLGEKDKSLKEYLSEDERTQKIAQRKWVSMSVTVLYILWNIFVGYIIYMVGIQDNNFTLPNYVMISLIAPLAVITLGSLYLIVRNLFPKLK